MIRKSKRKIRFIVTYGSEEKRLFNEQITKMYCELVNGEITELL